MEAYKRTRIKARALKKNKGTVLDAGIWGKLQDHIKLQTVYEKLPYEEFCRLRVVCKAWNHAALQRLEPTPYFVVVPFASLEEQNLNGVLTYNFAFEKYSCKWQHFPLHDEYGVPFEVEGLIFCHHPNNLKQPGVYNVHTKTWHEIPPVPKESRFGSAIGMMVDTSERPYSF